MRKAAASHSTRTAVRFTANFESNLAHIKAYWSDKQFPAGFDRLIAELQNTTIPILETHPRLGRPFFERQAQTLQAKQKMQAITSQLARLAANAELREYVMTDYTALYALVADTLYLLAIKHHKLLAFEVAHI
jgi:tagatose-1,6-bisphosphate aldolase non-catalytic subunit AgaZ/GatZ